MNTFALVCWVTALLASSFAVPYVRRFSLDSKPKHEVKLRTFRFQNCLPVNKEEAVVNSLSFLPDPLTFPGTLNVSFDIDVKDDVNSPLKAHVYLGKKVGSVWVKIPCIGEIGSCTYDDFCQILSLIPACPGPFIAAGVPCQCPFSKGSYRLSQANFEVDIDIFPPGDYHGQANLTVNNNIVGCYDLLFSFS